MSPLFALKRRALRSHRDQPAIGREVRVRVAGGYHPDTITAPAGVPLRIVFHREESNACSEQVVFPTLGKTATLPQGQDVAIDLTAPDPGTHPFTCAMGMLHGTLTITANQPTPTSAVEPDPEAAGTGRTTLPVGGIRSSQFSSTVEGE